MARVHDRTSIEELAMDYHMFSQELRFDEAWLTKERMALRFGWERACKAITEMEDTMKMIGL